MPKRVLVAIGEEQWTAEIAGKTVVLGDSGPVGIEVDQTGNRLRADAGGQIFEGRAAIGGDTVWVSIAGEVFAVRVGHSAGHRGRGSADQAVFTAPMSATVVRIAVAPGDAVKDGDVLISLEAMKMELPIRAPRDGVVRAIHCREGELVQPDQVLLDFE